MILSKAISKVKLPIPKIPSFSLINLTIEYGVVPAITIERETNVNVTPHFPVSYTHLTLPTKVRV